MGKTLILFLCAALCTLDAAAPAVFAIRDARIVTVSGPVIERGTVLIRDGLIQEVGASVALPSDAWVIEGKGLTVYPGLIDALSTLGIAEAAATTAITTRGGGRTPALPSTPSTPAMPSETPGPPGLPSIITTTGPPAQGPEDRPSNTSWVRAADLISPTDRRLESARSAGFTTAVTFPPRGIFAGQGAVINLAGEKAGQMVIASPAGLYLTVSSGGFSSFPSSLFGVMAYIRQVFLDSEHYVLAKQAYQNQPAGTRRPAYDRALEGVLDAPRLLIPAVRAVELDRMVRFAAELKRKAVLYGGHEAYRVTDLLKKSGTPLLVSLRWPERSRDADPEDQEPLRILELRERAPSTPAALVKAGVPFAFYTEGVTTSRELQRAIKRALDAGLSSADALRAFTLSPAEIYGVADRLGSLDKGKIANLVVTSGELFQEKTQVKYVFIDGLKYEPLPETPEEVTR